MRDIADKIQETRLCWFGHVLRKPHGYVGNRCLNLALPGKRPRGRPKKRWIDIAESEARGLWREDAKNRAKWRKAIKKADPGRLAQAGNTLGKEEVVEYFFRHFDWENLHMALLFPHRSVVDGIENVW